MFRIMAFFVLVGMITVAPPANAQPAAPRPVAAAPAPVADAVKATLEIEMRFRADEAPGKQPSNIVLYADVPHLVASVAQRLHEKHGVPAPAGTGWTDLDGRPGLGPFYLESPYPDWPLQIWFLSDTSSASAVRLRDVKSANATQDLDELAAELRKLVVPAEEAARELPKVREEVRLIEKELAQLGTLIESQKKAMQEITSERMKQLELERQRLQMDVMAKDARGRAIREQMDAALRAATTRAASDPVIEQLKLVVALRQKELDRYREVRAGNGGSVTQSDVDKVEETLIQANARLAEREQAVTQSLSNDLLARLAEELATLAIDQAELRARLDLVEQRLPPEDPARLDEARLRELDRIYHLDPDLRTEPGSPKARPAADLPLLRELRLRERVWKDREVALRLEEVKITTPPAAKAERRIRVNELVNVEISDLTAVGVKTVKTTRVSESGNISLPFIGLVKVDGLSEAEAEQHIVDTYHNKQIVQRAQVSLTITEPATTQEAK